MTVNKSREAVVRIVVKKRGHAAAHHGGAWKVAFADFMTAMFALFLVLWLINQSSDVKSAVAGYFQDPLGRADEYGSSILPGDGAQSQVPQPLSEKQVIDLRRDRLQEVGEDLEKQLKEVPDLAEVKDQISIEVTEDGLRISLIEDAKGTFFEVGSATLSDNGRRILSLIGGRLGKLPNAVRIEGFTDARPYSGRTDYSNWELSADRANTARRILTQDGLHDAQVQQVRGLADRELRDPKNPLSPKNRRIAITVLLANAAAEPEDVIPASIPASEGPAPGADSTSTASFGPHRPGTP